MAAKKIQDCLHDIDREVLDGSLDSVILETFERSAALLAAKCKVLKVLQTTAQHFLDDPREPLALSNEQCSRLSKCIDAAYGGPNDRREARWVSLRSMDCASFVFIGISYTPLTLDKMSRIEFEYLISIAKELLYQRNLPRKWLFCNEAQITIAGKCHVEGANNFRKGQCSLSTHFDKKADVTRVL